MTTPNKWEEIISEFKSSGQSQRIFSAEHGLKRSNLRYWLERAEQLEIGKEICFAEIITAGDNH